MKETQLKLSKNQVQNVINSQLSVENGLNDLFSMLVNGLMLSERQSFLATDNTEGNKGNGYRKAIKAGIGSKLQLSIPRDRLGVFKPVILGLLNEQEEQIKTCVLNCMEKGSLPDKLRML